MPKPLWEVFQYCPRCGCAADQRGATPFHCTACGFNLYFNAATAVAGIVVNQRDEVLLVRRACDPGRGMLELPGGFVDAGEAAEEALRRELKEELDISVGRLTYLTSLPNMYLFQGVIIPVADIVYVCEVASRARITPARDEIDEWFFCTPTSAELDDMVFPSNRQALSLYCGLRHPSA